MAVRPFPDILCPRLRFSVCYGGADKFSSVKNPIYDRKMRCGNQMLSKTRKLCFVGRRSINEDEEEINYTLDNFIKDY